MTKIVLAHGGGGRLSHDLIKTEILSRFGKGPLRTLPDAAVVEVSGSGIVFSTDSFVVQPLFFPGGNIGHLAVHGTINDIAVAGGNPRYISLALILEEGFDSALLGAVLDSIKSAAEECGVQVVTGDTKVVSRGQCDGMYINTAGIGEKTERFDPDASKIAPGDILITSGTLGCHGMAVMTAREGMNLHNGPVSDTGPVHRLVASIEEFGRNVKFMRDPTRGGLASVLHEIVENRPVDVVVRQKDIPFSPAAQAVSEMLGIDLLHVASEGRVLVFCAPDAAEKIRDTWRKLPEGKDSQVIGVVNEGRGRVVMETVAGGRRLIDMPEGELLPRIC